MNEQPKYTPDDVVSDDLKDLVREIYARDYELLTVASGLTAPQDCCWNSPGRI